MAASPSSPVSSPAEHVPTRPSRRRLAAVASLAALLAVGTAALLSLRPPAPGPVDAPAEQFSAGRAVEHVAVIAAQTHAAGSAANDGVRHHLENTLRGLGLATEVQDSVGPEAGQLSGGTGGATLARVRNVVAQLPGTNPTGRVFLVAHYDSVQTGPGGNDDAAGTSAILEVARALTAGPRPRNDIVFVLTDAEEACLCGAAAFAAGHPLAADGGVVLNLEARGSTGPVIMFETSRRNAALVNAFGRAAPHPVGTSFAVEIYRLLPNDTDFTAFLDEGFVGLNSAYIDGAAIYHTPQDTPANLDRRSLQQHGANALGLAREFGGANLASLQSAGDATYFPVPGGLVRYPGWLVWPLAVLALLAVATLGWAVRRQGHASWPRIAAGFGLTLIPIIVAPVGGWLLWTAVTAIRPGYAWLLDPYRPGWYRLAVVAAAAFVLLGWYAWTRRRVGAAAAMVAGLGWLAVLGLLLAALAPGGAYLTTLPALAGALGGLVASRLPANGIGPVLAHTLAAVVAVLVLLPTVVLLFPALGMSMGAVAALVVVLLGLAALPIVELLYPEGGRSPMALRLAAVPALAAGLATVIFTVAGLAVDRFDDQHPIPTHLMYALDADTGTARWLSHEENPQPWTDRYVGEFESLSGDFPGLGDRELRTGPAQPAILPAPALTTLADNTTAGVRTIRLRLVPQRSVRLVSLHVDTGTATVERASVAGHPVPVNQQSGQRWGFGIVFHAPPKEGIEVELALRPVTGQPLVRVMDASDGLDGLPGFQPRPAGVGIAGSHSSEMVAVARTYPL